MLSCAPTPRKPRPIELGRQAPGRRRPYCSSTTFGASWRRHHEECGQPASWRQIRQFSDSKWISRCAIGIVPGPRITQLRYASTVPSSSTLIIKLDLLIAMHTLMKSYSCRVVFRLSITHVTIAEQRQGPRSAV